MATVRIEPQPCNHVHVHITKGIEIKTYITTKEVLLSEAEDSEEAFKTILNNVRVFCQLSPNKNWDVLKTAIEAKEFKI